MRDHKDQFRTVLAFEIILISMMGFAGFWFWDNVCSDSLSGCLNPDNEWAPLQFLGLGLLRPIFFTPTLVLATFGGSTFGPVLGTVLTAIATTLSCFVFYLPGHYLGKRLVRPWLAANLPATWQLLRTQDYKVVFITRWIPLFPFDILSLVFGVVNFHPRRVALFTFLGVLPESYFFAQLGSTPDSELLSRTIANLFLFGAITSVPLAAYEYISRKQGASLWRRIKRVYYEIVYEARINNDIIKRRTFDKDQIPVIMLYGFFSSRRSLTVLERLLTNRGFQVMSFNLGGSLGVFFTRGVQETAAFIDRKIRRQIQRHGFEKVHIVAHSKGGLVALWWVLRMGGYKYCDKVITLGTPYKGSYLTYLGLFTPLGFFWQDLWQMRPGSKFLRDLHNSNPPDNLTIYNAYSNRDRVCHGAKGIFQYRHKPGRVVAIPMHHLSHFEYLYKRDVGDSLAYMLNGDFSAPEALVEAIRKLTDKSSHFTDEGEAEAVSPAAAPQSRAPIPLTETGEEADKEWDKDEPTASSH